MFWNVSPVQGSFAEQVLKHAHTHTHTGANAVRNFWRKVKVCLDYGVRGFVYGIVYYFPRVTTENNHYPIYKTTYTIFKTHLDLQGDTLVYTHYRRPKIRVHIFYVYTYYYTRAYVLIIYMYAHMFAHIADALEYVYTYSMFIHSITNVFIF